MDLEASTTYYAEIHTCHSGGREGSFHCIGTCNSQSPSTPSIKETPIDINPTHHGKDVIWITSECRQNLLHNPDTGASRVNLMSCQLSTCEEVDQVSESEGQMVITTEHLPQRYPWTQVMRDTVHTQGSLTWLLSSYSKTLCARSNKYRSS
jgi:hypothetical protein